MTKKFRNKQVSTVFENYFKMSRFNLAFSIKFCLIKIDLYGNAVCLQAFGFQNSLKWVNLGIFN